MQQTQDLRILVVREGEMLVAQCVELDVSTQASDMKTLHKRMDALLELEMQLSEEKTGDPHAGIPKAPEVFDEMWSRSELLANGISGKPTAIAA
ncbi:MAG: hypothetical protein AAF192_23730 [Pseudomonadota bacterium]